MSKLTRWVSLVLVTAASMGIVVPAAANALPALSNASPAEFSHFETGWNNNTGKNLLTDVARAILLRSDHGTSANGYYDIYYDTDPTGRNIRLNFWDCEGGRTIRVDVTTKGNARRTNAIACGQTWDIPIRDIDRVQALGGYRVSLNIRMSNPTGQPSKNYSVLYRVAAPGGKVGYRETLSSSGTNAGIRQYNLPQRKNGYYGTHRFPFGLSCDAKAGWYTVKVYDTDNRMQKSNKDKTPLRFGILKNDTLLKKAELRGLASSKGTATITTAGWITPATEAKNDNASMTTTIQVYMRPGEKLELRVRDVLAAGDNTSWGHNFIRVGVPGDGIYGSSGFQCANQMSVTTELKVLAANGTTVKRNWSSASANVQVGDKLRWRHVMRVNGTMEFPVDNPSPTNVTTTTAANATKGRWAERNFQQRSTDLTAPYSYGTDTTGYGRQGGIYGGASYNPIQTIINAGTGTGTGGAETATPYTVTSADQGHNLCERYKVTPRAVSRNNVGAISRSGVANSTSACARLASPPGSASHLKTSIEVEQELVTQGGAVVTVPQIDNDGTGAANNVQWRIVRFSPTAVSGNQANTSEPCAYFGSSCELVAKSGDTGVTVAPGSNTTIFGNGDNRSSVIPVDAAIGSEYCFALSVTPYQPGQSPQQWFHSKPACTAVVKKPKVRVLGGDVRTSGAIQTGTHTARFGEDIADPLNIFGSTARYGALSSLANTGFTSAGALQSARPGGDVEGTLLQTLTFANTPPSGAVPPERGFYEVPLLPAIDFQTSGACPGGANSLSTGTYQCGDIDLNGNSSVDGTVIIKSTGKVTIKDDIVYSGTKQSNPRNLPQVIIIAEGDIVIEDDVKQVDAWLITPNGLVKTCGEAVTGGQTKSDCNQKLTVNGPVVANSIALRRTAGSDGSVGNATTGGALAEPAEVFNLRPDAYLWASAYGTSHSYRTTSVLELPPRF